MAYTITHIIIADMVLEYLPQIEDYSTYILGTIAPDVVHANQNYSAKLKERSPLESPVIYLESIRRVKICWKSYEPVKL